MTSQTRRATFPFGCDHGKIAERVEVGHEAHVRFLDPREALDGRPVELDLAVERLLELRARHLDVLDDSEDVRELQAQEPDAFLVAGLQDLGGLQGHLVPPFFFDFGSRRAEILGQNAESHPENGQFCTRNCA